MELFKKSAETDRELLDVFRKDRDAKWVVAFLRAEARKWDKLPKGWNEESAKKFWDSLTGEVKHKVTKCIKEMQGNVDDPGAFCASLADLVDPGWRSRTATEDAFPKTLTEILEDWFRKALGKSSYTYKELKVTWKKSILPFRRGTPWDFRVVIKGIGLGPTFITGSDFGGVLSAITGETRPADAKYAVLREIADKAEHKGLKIGYPAGSPNPALYHGKDLEFVFYLAEIPNQGTHVAAFDSPILSWLGKKERLVPHILKGIKRATGEANMRELQQGITGFIESLFRDIQGGTLLAQKLWRIFENSQISQNTEIGRDVAYNFRRYFTGTPSFQLLQAAAVSLDLLRRGRMPNLMVKAETIFMADLKDEMEKTKAPEQVGKSLSANEVLKKMVSEYLPKAREYLDRLPKVGIEISFVSARALIVDVLEDSNWHSLSHTLGRMTPGIENISIPSSLVGEISREMDYSINLLAVLGISILSIVRDKEGISVLKREVMTAFPDTFTEME